MRWIRHFTVRKHPPQCLCNLRRNQTQCQRVLHRNAPRHARQAPKSKFTQEQAPTTTDKAHKSPLKAAALGAIAAKYGSSTLAAIKAITSTVRSQERIDLTSPKFPTSWRQARSRQAEGHHTGRLNNRSRELSPHRDSGPTYLGPNGEVDGGDYRRRSNRYRIPSQS